ncbi:MAG: oxidoreductase [Sulfitobacter sp.]|nr:oxidoreductase [Sulfitobacter sp.]
MQQPRFPGIRITTNGNQLVSYYTEARLTDGGVFYPITPSTEMGENYQLSYAEGNLNVFGKQKLAIETEGEHAAQGGAIALSLTGKRVVNFTSGQGLVYGLEQYYHAPGKLSTMVVEIAARALTKHALNVHCGHDDIYTALDTGWTMLFSKDSQQAADQALILRRVTETTLNPGINIQDGFLTSHLERTFLKHEAGLIREFLGAPDDLVDSPTPAQQELFGPRRRRVPIMINLAQPAVIGPVQNQEHYMNGVIARRNNFAEHILGALEASYADFAKLTGRKYGLLTEYATEDAETVFVSLGSAAENIEAAVDHMRANDGVKVGSVHVNVLRPFPMDAIVRALAGKKNVIILERTDEPLAVDNPLTREIRATLAEATCSGKLADGDMPTLYSASYGLGSRDFRPEHILGAYEFALGKVSRQDGRNQADGTRFFVLGIDHDYAVVSDRTPSLLPKDSIAVRLHSIGGWGMITTGKNLGEIIGAFGAELAQEQKQFDELGRPKEALHISANPKYGSEKKGAPTSYFLVVAPERVRVNCDLRHVNVVLCCDPKAFTHTNPIDGIAEGGTFVWESSEDPAEAWMRIPRKYRQEIIDKNIRIVTLPGFDIASEATSREDLRLRMQGNAFLGAFFAVSDFLDNNKVDEAHFHSTVRKQYEKKFGRFGDAVVESNMTVMDAGFARVQEVPHGSVDAPDNSNLRIAALFPCSPEGSLSAPPIPQAERPPLFQVEKFDSEFRAGLGYNQPASALASVGLIAPATGATTSKYVSRRATPVWHAENCTQCMDCIVACPDTALPNTAQDIKTFLRTAASGYTSDSEQRTALLGALPGIEQRVRARMMEGVLAKTPRPFVELIGEDLAGLDEISEQARSEFMAVFETIPVAYEKTTAIFRGPEKKNEGAGGLFAIMVSDLCKGCGECVTECGSKNALTMEVETEAINAAHESGVAFLKQIPDTPQKYLGKYNAEHPEESNAVALRNHLMVQSKYEALVSGDGACAGCGEKTILRSMMSLTEAYMRPIFHKKADRMDAKVARLKAEGVARLEALRELDSEQYLLYMRAVASQMMGLGGESDEDTIARMADRGELENSEVIHALCAVLTQDAFNHRDLQAVEGRLANGMSVMAMGAHTGCNSVYGSTPPATPHPYPWMNSLFQDGVTVAWLFGESFIQDHCRRSVVPERLCDALLERSENVISERELFDLSHLTDNLLSAQETRELPKAWAVGGDGGMGDIGYQNLSKVVLQNRPNVMALLLDTQVYSNTGGQNSDSTPMPGGGDMNQFGTATQGKMTEKKGVAESFLGGHGSPFVAQVSAANMPKLFKAVLDGLEYRGTAFFQCYTSCQPEHGVPDDLSSIQAGLVRDSRGMPEFTWNPSLGETFVETIDLKGNPNVDRDWMQKKPKGTTEAKAYTVAHWATTEARFRRHLKPTKSVDGLVRLEDLLLRITQDDVVQRHVLDPEHFAFVPDFGCYFETDDGKGGVRYHIASRQMVLFCVERRRAWRLMQSRAGVVNLDYQAQRALLAKRKEGELETQDFIDRPAALFEAELEALKPQKKRPAKV